MDIKGIKLSEKLLAALRQLALKVELFDGQRFRIGKSNENVAELLQYAAKVNNQEVQKAYLGFMSLLGSKQEEFLKKIGAAKNAETATTPNTAAPSKQEAAVPEEKRKYRVYRGQKIYE